MTKQTKSRFEVSVTQADIDRALQNNSAKCVVAQAIARTLPDATRIGVDTQTIRFTIGEERFAYLTPYSVTGYVIAFDAGDEIHPFRFRLYEEQKLAIRRRARTETGAANLRAKAKTRRAKTKAVEAQQQFDTMLDEVEAGLTDPDTPPPSPAKLEELRTKAKAADAGVRSAEENQASVKAALTEAQERETTTTTPGRTVPRVFKTNARHYGHRKLRINQQG